MGVGEEFKPVDVPSGGDPNLVETGVSDMGVDSVEAFDKVVEEAVFEGMELEAIEED